MIYEELCIRIYIYTYDMCTNCKYIYTHIMIIIITIKNLTYIYIQYKCIYIYIHTYPVYISTGVSDGFLKHQLGKLLLTAFWCLC